jgi:predicted nucleotide-binding protein
MRRRPSPQPESRNLDGPQLEAAIRTIDRRIADLQAFDVSAIQERWDPRVTALETKLSASLAEIFGEGTPEYNRHSIGSLDGLPISMLGHGYAPERIRQSVSDGIRGAIVNLQTTRDLLRERLESLGPRHAPVPVPARREPGRRVFIVHGRDEAAKEAVARFVAQLQLNPIILHEQPNAGRTIIEKLEGHLDVDFAVIILTPDDVGGVQDDQPQLQNRARQNVVLELGLFIGALGRSRVCALHKGVLELPSDFDGVVYIPMDDAGGWRLLLAREIKQSGIDLDLNLAM